MLAIVLFDNFRAFFRSLASYHWWQVAIELVLIGAVVYWVVRFLHGTRGARLLRGIVLLLIALYLVVELLDPVMDIARIRTLYQSLLGGVGFAIAVAFQPELRRALMRLGETRLFRGMTAASDEQVDGLLEAAQFCSRRKIGMLVAVERDVGLGGVAESGTRLDADLTAELLETIFWPNSPLHDLGVIVTQGRISYAGVQFPLAESDELAKELGSRHRAAVGMSQESDAVLLVVSEETGDISVAERGVLYRRLTPDILREVLDDLLNRGRAAPQKRIEETSPQTQIIRTRLAGEDVEPA